MNLKDAAVLAVACVTTGPLAVLAVAWWQRRCISLPWHRWELDKRLTDVCSRYRCTCGRLWAINTDVQGVLPWEEVADFYREREKEAAAHATAEPKRCHVCRGTDVHYHEPGPNWLVPIPGEPRGATDADE